MPQEVEALRALATPAGGLSQSPLETATIASDDDERCVALIARLSETH